jgi:anti-anti-sigma factor
MRAEHRLDTVLIRPCGEFDMSCERPFREQLSRLLDADTSAVILDLQELSFIDSTGL